MAASPLTIVYSKGRFWSSTTSMFSLASPSRVTLIEGKVWLSVSSWLTITKPSRYVVSVRDSETIWLLAETRVDEKCVDNNRSRVPKIAPVFLFNHVNFPANTQVSSF